MSYVILNDNRSASLPPADCPEVFFGEVTLTVCRLCAEVPADVNSRDAGLEEMPNRVASGIVGGSDIYLSAPSPGGDQSERATYILYIASVLLNDLLSAFTPLSTLVLPTK